MANIKKILFVVSIVINIGLIIFCSLRTEKSPLTISLNSANKNDTVIDFEIASMNNFENVFLDRNDSIYKSLWNEAFENQPQNAFLISCSYFYVTKEKRILKDIEISISQLQDVYQRKIKINN